jgi:O-methyltransferase involved in polyketide biosynthesis
MEGWKDRPVTAGVTRAGLGLDTSRPNIARVYDYWLGGKDNFAVDREVAGRMLELDPGLRDRVRDNRAFVAGVAEAAARQDITQFIDLGAGLPARPSVHEAARAVNPLARVAYVDNDPVVVSHARALLASGEGLAAISADLRDPPSVLADPALREVIDLSRPTCVILAAVAHFMPAAQAAEVSAGYMRAMPAGSWLAVSVAHFTDEELLARLFDLHTTAPFQNHGAAQVASFLAGLDLAAPGIAEARRWLTGIGGVPGGRHAYMLCGAAVKKS